MLSYVDMVNHAIDYVEDNIRRNISLQELSERHYMSAFHFYRIFRAVTNRTVKSYVEARKLTEAAKLLRESDIKIIDVALEFGYGSPETFTRSFKRNFGVTPSEFRHGSVDVGLFERPFIAERAFKNENKDIVVDFEIEEVGDISLVGRQLEFNPELPSDLARAKRFVETFVEDCLIPFGRAKRLINVSRSTNKEPNTVLYFTGFEAESGEGLPTLPHLRIPASKYAVFRYKGDKDGLGGIVDTVLDDLYKCICISRLKLNPVGIDFFEIYDHDYRQTDRFRIYLPIL